MHLFYLTTCQIECIFDKIVFMKIMTVGEFKAQFSKVIEKVKKGGEIAVTYGKDKEVVGVFAPPQKKKFKRKLGILEGKVKVVFAKDFKMTEEEFINL